MISKNTNRNGVKLLAAIAVFAIAFVGLALVPAFETDAGTEDAVPASTEEAKILEKGADGKYHIKTAEDLWTFAKMVNELEYSFVGETVVLDNDISLKGEKEWTPVSQMGLKGWTQFTGTFDGNNMTISDFVVSDSTVQDKYRSWGYGFFGALDFTATIENLTISNATVSGHHYVGAIAGYFTGVMKNCHVTDSNISATVGMERQGDKAGAIAGFLNPTWNDTIRKGVTSIEDCSASRCTVEAEYMAGQLFGAIHDNFTTISEDGEEKRVTIENCKATDVSVEIVDDPQSKDPNAGKYLNNSLIGFLTRDGDNEAPSIYTVGKDGKLTLLNVEDIMVEDVSYVLGSKVTTITIPAKTIFNSTITYDGNSISFKKLVAGEGGLVIKPGSLTISGTIDASEPVEITASGEVKIGNTVVTSSATTPGGLTIEYDGSADTTVSVEGYLTINQGATLIIDCPIESKTTEGEDGKPVVGKIVNNGTVKQNTGADVTGIEISGTGTVVNDSDDSEMSSVSVGGESDIGITTFPAKQIVTVNGNWTLINGADITIKGKLVVPAGATLTIEAGAKLTLDNNAIAEIDGTVVIAENDEDLTATFNVKSGDVTVEGNLQIAGAFVIEKGKLTVKSGSDASVEETGSLEVGVNGNVVIEKSASFDIFGAIDAAKIENNGTFTFDSKVPSENSTITMEKHGVLNIVNLTAVNGGELKVVGKQNNSVVITVGTTGTAIAGGKIVATVSGLQVNEKFIAKTTSEGADKYSMIISGDLGVTYSYTAVGSEDEPSEMGAMATITLDGSTNAMEISNGLTIGKNVTIINRGMMSVSSDVSTTEKSFTFSETTFKPLKNDTTGKIVIINDGSIAVKEDIPSESGIDATKYSIGSGENKVVYYVTIDKAIATANAGTATDFTVVGEQTVSASATLPTKTKLDITGSKLKIGTSEKTDITLTIASGATVKGSSTSEITVSGTLYAEDKTNIISAVREIIKSDVYSEQIDEKEKPVRNGWAKWTNVYSALSEASENQIIKASNDLTISKDLVIPAGVVLDTNGHEMKVNENVVVTVNGTLFVNGNTVKMAVTAEDGKKNAKMTVSGFVRSDNEIEDAVKAGTDAYAIPGAYYSIDSVNYVTTVENAAKVISTTDGQTVTLKGGDITAGDVTFAGSDDKIAHVIVDTKIKFGTFTLDKADVTFHSSTTPIVAEGTVTNSIGTVKLFGKATDLKFASSDVKEVKTLTVTGGLGAQGTENVSKFEVTGTVSIGDSDLDSATVDGTLNVVGINTKINTLLVNGSVVVTEDKILKSTTATIMGTISAEEGTAKATIGAMFIGITEDYATVGASATVVGDVTLDTNGYALVEPSSSVTEKITKRDTIKKTEFYIDDVLYLTAFVNGTTTEKINNIDAHVEDAKFEGWHCEGTPVANTDSLGSKSSVSAEIELNIYEIDIVIGAGIENVAVDGVIYYNGSFAPIAAGTHTISYTLKSNYSGTPTLTVNGVEQSGMTFTTSGTPADGESTIPYKLQLSGVAASEPTTPVTPVQPIVTSNDDMGLTEYLLIVLVVLAAILVIIVSIRMMRS